MAQNAYSSEINNSSIVGRDEKGIHYRDDTDTISGSDKRKRNKAEENEEEKLPFYPAFCFPASPTHFTWVKMSIADIHRLQSRRGFEGTTPIYLNLLFLSSGLTKYIYTYRSEYILPQKPSYPIRLSGRLHPLSRRV